MVHVISWTHLWISLCRVSAEDSDAGEAAPADAEKEDQFKENENEEEGNAPETLQDLLAAARAAMERARLTGQSLGWTVRALAAIRQRIDCLADPEEAHAGHMACGSLLASM